MTSFTCHIHDNNGYNDLHGIPFDGTIDWTTLMEQLRSCPRMIEFQTEVCFDYGLNWAGPLLAPKGGRLFHPTADRYFLRSGLLTGTCGHPRKHLAGMVS